MLQACGMARLIQREAAVRLGSNHDEKADFNHAWFIKL